MMTPGWRRFLAYSSSPSYPGGLGRCGSSSTHLGPGEGRHMVAVVTESDTEFVSFADVRIGREVSESAIRRRMRARGVSFLIDPRDARKRVLRRDDVARLFAPIPAPARTGRAAE